MKVDLILFPTDYSAHAEEALSSAVDMAKIFDAKLVLMHSFHAEIPMVSAIEGPYNLPPGFYKELGAASSAHIEEVAKALREKEGIEVSGVALSSPAAYAIVAKAEELPADLIVMATRGLSGLKHMMLGSVAERIVRTAPCPVLTIKTSD